MAKVHAMQLELLPRAPPFLWIDVDHLVLAEMPWVTIAERILAVLSTTKVPVRLAHRHTPKIVLLLAVRDRHPVKYAAQIHAAATTMEELLTLQLTMSVRQQ